MNQRFPIRVFACVCLMLPAGLAMGQVDVAATVPSAASQAAAQMVQPLNEQSKAVADAAWGVLQALREYVHASQILGDPPRRARELDQAKRTLAGLVTLRPGGDAETLPAYRAIWPAVVGHYVDGFDRSRMQLVESAQQVMVIVPATNPQDQKVYDEIFQQITKELQDQGYAGEALASQRGVRLRRELAQKGVGYPITAMVIVTLRKVDGQWKASELDMRPPSVQPSTSQPASGPTVIQAPKTTKTTINRPTTQPAR